MQSYPACHMLHMPYQSRRACRLLKAIRKGTSTKRPGIVGFPIFETMIPGPCHIPRLLPDSCCVLYNSSVQRRLQANRYFIPVLTDHCILTALHILDHHGKTQAEVRKRLSEAVKESSEADALDDDDLTVGQWLAIWQCHFLGNAKPGTVASYEMQVRVHKWLSTTYVICRASLRIIDVF